MSHRPAHSIDLAGRGVHPATQGGFGSRRTHSQGHAGACMRCFFFSSRRRHTILTCDWSSDVCSSDLIDIDANDAVPLGHKIAIADVGGDSTRSEERRVGKECRSRWASDHLKEKDQCRTGPRILLILPAEAFTPRPKVDSALVELIPKDTPELACDVFFFQAEDGIRY